MKISRENKSNIDVEENTPSNKKRLFVDMDGTLAEWRNISFDAYCSEEFAVLSMEEKLNKVLYSPGYFISLKEHDHVVKAISRLVEDDNDVEVFVLSCVIPDRDGVSPLAQKNDWLDKHLPCIDAEHRVFVPNGKNKTDYVPNGVQEGDFLLDDYTKNLNEWESTGKGIGIKLLNQVNSSNGKWNGSKISNGVLSKFIARDILAIMDGDRIEHNEPFKSNKTIHFVDFLNIVQEKLSQDKDNEITM